MNLSDRGGMGMTKHGKSGHPTKNARVKQSLVRFCSEEENRSRKLRERAQRNCAFGSVSDLMRSSTKRK